MDARTARLAQLLVDYCIAVRPGDWVLVRGDLLGLPFDRPAMARLLADHVAGRANRTLPLWSILTLALWNERYLRR